MTRALLAFIFIVLFPNPALCGAGGSAGRPAPRIAVLPFLPRDGSPLAEGRTLSLKFADHLGLRGGDVFAVDWSEARSLIGSDAATPQALARSEAARRLGRSLQADGVVLGSFVSSGSRLRMEARMILVSSGRVSRAMELELERDVVIDPPSFVVDVPIIEKSEALEIRDAVFAAPCESASVRVDELERTILDLKARYWALQLARGVNMRAIKFNPGSTITDPALKREFYDRIRRWQAQAFIPELTPTEIKQFADMDEKAVIIARRCGIL